MSDDFMKQAFTAMGTVIAAMGGVIAILWKAQANRERKQDERLDDCEKERKDLRKELTRVWRWLATKEREEGDTPE